MLILAIISLVSAQLQAVPEEVKEVKIDLSQAQPVNNEDKYFYDKVYAVDSTTHSAMTETFKNVITLVYDQDEEIQTKLLQDVLDKFEIKKNKIDIIAVKLPVSSGFTRGVHVQHFGTDHFFDQIEYEGLKSIICPSLQFLQSDQVTEYMNSHDNKLLVLMKEESPKIIDIIEPLMRNGLFLEAQIKEIKGFIGDWNSYQGPTLLLTSNGEVKQYTYNLSHVDQITDFIYLESLPTIIELGESNYARVFGGSIQTQIHLLGKEFPEAYKLAAEYNRNEQLKYERVLFCHSDYETNKDLWELFDFDENTPQPQLVITHTNFRNYQINKYISEDRNLTIENIQNFIKQVREKSILPYYRSEDVPINQTDVIKVVGQTFLQEVIKGRQNTLVLFWDSKDPESAEPYFDLIKQIPSVVDSQKVKVTTFDLALNEHFKVRIDSAPKFVLYVASNKNAPKEYLKSSNLIIEEMKNWLTYWVGPIKTDL